MPRKLVELGHTKLFIGYTAVIIQLGAALPLDEDLMQRAVGVLRAIVWNHEVNEITFIERLGEVVIYVRLVARLLGKRRSVFYRIVPTLTSALECNPGDKQVVVWAWLVVWIVRPSSTTNPVLRVTYRLVVKGSLNP